MFADLGANLVPQSGLWIKREIYCNVNIKQEYYWNELTIKNILYE